MAGPGTQVEKAGACGARRELTPILPGPAWLHALQHRTVSSSLAFRRAEGRKSGPIRPPGHFKLSSSSCYSGNPQRERFSSQNKLREGEANRPGALPHWECLLQRARLEQCGWRCPSPACPPSPVQRLGHGPGAQVQRRVEVSVCILRMCKAEPKSKTWWLGRYWDFPDFIREQQNFRSHFSMDETFAFDFYSLYLSDRLFYDNAA